MPDSRDYKSAMEKVAAGQRWKQATLEKMQAETAAQKVARPRRTIPFGRRAIPLTTAAICLLVIPAAARSLTSVSGGATAADQASPRAATRQMPESSAAVAPEAAPFALAAAPEAAMAENGAPDETAAPAYTTVEADSPEAALPADTQPADEAEGADAALEQLDEILAAEGEGRTRADVLASGLAPDGSFAFVLAGESDGSYRLYLVSPGE